MNDNDLVDFIANADQAIKQELGRRNRRSRFKAWILVASVVLIVTVLFFYVNGIKTSENRAVREKNRAVREKKEQEKRIVTGEGIEAEIFKIRISSAVKKDATKKDVRDLLDLIIEKPTVLESPITLRLIKGLPNIIDEELKCNILKKIIPSIPSNILKSIQFPSRCQSLNSRDELKWDGKDQDELSKKMKNVVDGLMTSSSEANSKAIILLARFMERSEKIENAYISFRNEVLLRELGRRFDSLLNKISKRFSIQSAVYFSGNSITFFSKIYNILNNTRILFKIFFDLSIDFFYETIPLSMNLIANLHSVGDRSLRHFLNAPENRIFSENLMKKSTEYLKMSYSDPFSIFSNYAFFWFAEKYHKHSKSFVEWTYKNLVANKSIKECRKTEHALSHGVPRMQFHLLSNNLKFLTINKITYLIEQFSILNKECDINEIQFAYQIFISKALMKMIATLHRSKRDIEINYALFLFEKITYSLRQIGFYINHKEQTSYYDISSSFQLFFVRHIDLLIERLPRIFSNKDLTLCHVLGIEYNDLITNYRSDAIRALIKLKERHKLCELGKQIEALRKYSIEHSLMHLAYSRISKTIVSSSDRQKICNKEDSWQTIISRFQTNLNNTNITQNTIKNLVDCLEHHERDTVRYSIKQVRSLLSKIINDKELVLKILNNIGTRWEIHTKLQDDMLSLIEDIYFYLKEEIMENIFKEKIATELKTMNYVDLNARDFEKKIRKMLSYQLSKFFSFEKINSLGSEAIKSFGKESNLSKLWKNNVKPFFLLNGVFTEKKLGWLFKKRCQEMCPGRRGPKIIKYLFSKNWKKMFRSKISTVTFSCEEIKCLQEKDMKQTEVKPPTMEEFVGSLSTHTRKIFYRFYHFQASKEEFDIFFKGVKDFSFDIRGIVIGRLLNEGQSNKIPAKNEAKKKAENQKFVLSCLKQGPCKLAEEHTSRKLFLQKYYER